MCMQTQSTNTNADTDTDTERDRERERGRHTDRQRDRRVQCRVWRRPHEQSERVFLALMRHHQRLATQKLHGFFILGPGSAIIRYQVRSIGLTSLRRAQGSLG